MENGNLAMSDSKIKANAKAELQVIWEMLVNLGLDQPCHRARNELSHEDRSTGRPITRIEAEAQTVVNQAFATTAPAPTAPQLQETT
jgi:hypothetical protein